MLRRVFGNWWFVTGLIVVLLVGTLCFGLPYFVGWMRPIWVRALFGGFVISGWLLWIFLRWRKARKASDAIAAELATPSASDQESAAVAQRMGEALASLKSSSGGKRDYLYSKPWYVIIGPPGAGKTTALLNSGLRFPYSDQSIKGVGGTRNLDFWFADEAALVDTAGRYTTQDSDASVDTQGWKSFLGQMKKHRPLSPINGVIVAIGVDELLRTDRSALDRHAALVRRRLSELRQTLEISFPVYLLLTKADLISGFVEFYDDLDVEGRRAVLGATLSAENSKPAVNEFVAEFDRLIMAQGDRQAKRLHEEVDVARRSLILGFPAQLAALRSRVARFIDGAFVSGDAPTGQLRGFYMTSGVQEGAPLDRILAGVAEAFQTTTGSRGGAGRTYFLNRLLTDVVFKEAGLVTEDPASRKRQQARVAIGFGAVAAATALVLAAWTVSFIQNRSFLSDLSNASGKAAQTQRQIGIDTKEVRSTDPDLEQALPLLRELRALPQGYAQQAAGEPGWLRRFGLYQSSHADQAVESYRAGLRRILLPRLLLRIEQFMASNTAEPMAVYQPLKVYLMLGGMGPMDKGTVKTWITGDWADEQFPGADRAATRQELTQHLDALLEDQGMSSAWKGGRQAPLDGAAIATARNALQTLSMADRAYAVLKQKALSSDEAPWRADMALAAGDAQAFANGEEVMGMTIPFFFTRSGYEKSFLIGLTTITEDFKKDLWVLGSGADSEGVRIQMNQIRPNVARLYAREYIDSWERISTLPKPANYFGDAAALGAFTKTPSPLKILLIELRKNTLFQGGTSGAKGIIERKLRRNSTLSYAMDDAKMLSSGENFDAGTEISNHFRDVQDYVGDGKALGALDEFIAAVKKAGSAVSGAQLATPGMGADQTQGSMAQAMGEVRTTAGGAPPQLQGFVNSAATGGSKATVSAAQGALSDAYATAVLPDCKTATEDKYPFFGTATADAELVDVQKVFALNGQLDAFMQQRIMPLLDTSGPIWRWNASAPATASLSPSSPDAFFKAQQMRNLLIGGLTVQFAVKTFGGTTDTAILAVGGTQYKFDKTTSEPRPVIWSAQGGVPEASVTLAAGEAPTGKVTASGPWALFRLMDKAKLENAGPSTINATFGAGTETIVFKVTLPGEQNPFVRGGGVWSFRCPASL